MTSDNKEVLPETGQSSSLFVPAEGFLQHLGASAFILVAVFLAYMNSLHGTWALDDTAIGRFSNIEQSLDLRLGYRKIAHLSFLINRMIDPIDVLNFRVMNLIIHSINGLLVYWLSFRTLRLPSMSERFGRYAYPVALLAGAIFALHPININAVAYIVQRMASLAAMFVLLAVIIYSYGRTASGYAAAALFYVLSGCCIFLGIFSKENGVMAFPLMLLYDHYFLGRPQGKDRLRKLALWGVAAAVLLGVSSVFLDLPRVFSQVAGLFLQIDRPIPEQPWTAVDVYWTPFQHILTEFRVVCRYLILLALPLPGSLVFDHWGYELSSGLTAPVSTIFSMAAIMGLLAAALLWRKKLPFLSFGILWYLVAISLESFVAVGSDLYFEHRNYLPAAGLFFGVVAQTAVLLKDTLLSRKPLLLAVLLLSVLLGGLTAQRNTIWKDSVTLWSDTVSKAPGNLRARMALGNAQLKVADLEAAASSYKKVLDMASADMRPQYFHDSAYSLGMVYLFLGRLPEARQVIDVMDARLAGNPATGILKGFYSSMTGDAETAIKLLNQSLNQAVGLDTVTVYTLLGDTYRRVGQLGQALESYKKAVASDPSFTAAYYGMGNVYFMLKDLGKAESYISRALDLDPVNPLALAQMADIVLVKKGPLGTAKQYAEKAVASSPPFYQPYASMATVLVMMGRDADADLFFRKAEDHGLRGYLLPYTKARAYFMRGGKEQASVYLNEVARMEDAPAELRAMIRKSQ